MTDEKVKMLLSLGRDEARLLLDHHEYALYRGIQKEMVNVVREYDVQLPLNCLQFELNGSVWLLGVTSRIALDQHSRSRNRRYRGRSDDRQ